MKFFTTLIIVCFLPVLVFSQANIFFSEYIEPDGGFNKALEIYNASDQTVNLDNYVIKSTSNSSTDWEFTDSFPAGATIAPGDVYVIIDDQADAADLIAAADWVTSGFEANFNGNDGRAIFFIDGDVLIDAIGNPNNPDALNWDVAGISEGTLNHTLIRKSSVVNGNTDWALSAGTNTDDSEWIVLDANTFENIGFHAYDGGSSDLPPSVTNITASAKVPAADEVLTVTASAEDDSGLVKVELYYSINDGEEQVLAMENITDAVYSANIPSSAYNNGDRLVYYILAEDNKAQQRKTSEIKLFVGDPSIAEVKQLDETGVLVFNGYYAQLTGVLTVSTGVFAVDDLQVFMQDGSAGINIRIDDDTTSVMTKGNSYTVVGKVDQFNGLIQIEPDDFGTDVVDNGAGELPAPIELTIAQLLSSPEAFESFLIKIVAVDSVAGGDPWPAEGENSNITITDDGETSKIEMRIDKETNIDGTPVPTFPINITGLFNQYDTSTPLTEGYQILPRSLEDIDEVTAIGEKLEIRPLVFKLYDAFPNPFNPQTTLKFDLPLKESKNAIELSIFNVLGQKITTLAKGKLSQGQHTFTWNAVNQPSGIYFAVLNTGTTQQISRLLLIK
ncbi:MAG: T9SS C-terminal target domain-containing protein [Calditrichaeota bacterium]|nr:MAG: T9SS C-terminal target domain-containing protein [Calditrichota bacterium]MBL1205707.1 T9SS C-terminal target domain-containing protein [Calditrichota bacterium]NOG45535.1 T9SS type A sorting domain-containing protein [Calditrichota bacterium]